MPFTFSVPVLVSVAPVASVPVTVPVKPEPIVTGLLSVSDAPLFTLKVSNAIARPLTVFPTPVNV